MQILRNASMTPQCLTIIKGNEIKCIDYVKYGYRKFTTGEYVSNAYRKKFGWKNTYYQNAKITISIPESIIDFTRL